MRLIRADSEVPTRAGEVELKHVATPGAMPLRRPLRHAENKECFAVATLPQRLYDNQSGGLVRRNILTLPTTPFLGQPTAVGTDTLLADPGQNFSNALRPPKNMASATPSPVIRVIISAMTATLG